MSLWKRKSKRRIFGDNRANLLMAVIFLLIGMMIYKLYSLQIVNHDLYLALASEQQEAFSKLQPARGKILLEEVTENESKFHPLATNKDFALIFVKPKEINNEDAPALAESFYEIFDEETAIEEVSSKIYFERKETFEKTFSKEDINSDLTPEEQKKIYDEKFNQWLADETKEFWNLKKDLELEEKKKSIVEEYLKKLTKDNDPYEPIARKVPEEQLEQIKSLNHGGIDFVMETFRYYPENESSCHILGFVRKKEEGSEGHYGLEGFFDNELRGTEGLMRVGRDASGKWVIVSDMEHEKAKDGSNLILTINRSIQFQVCKKIKEGVERYGASGGSVIVINPTTGEIMAMCSYPDFNPNEYDKVEDISVYNNPTIFEQYEPGSVFKPITMAAALDQEKVSPDTTYFDEGSVMISGWPKPIKNSDFDTHGGHGEVDMNTVLEESLNTGAIYAMRKSGIQTFAEYVKKFGFGEKTGIEIDTENQGNIRNISGDNIHEIYGATASFGQGISVTPLQMAASYVPIANGGLLMKPYIVKKIIKSDGTEESTQPKIVRRVISERAATLLTGMLVNVIEGGHAVKAAVNGYYVAGKTGTAQVASTATRGYSGRTNHTFVGFAPAEEAKFVMLVKLKDVKNVSFSASSAAPLFGEIAQFILNYLKVPKERDINNL